MEEEDVLYDRSHRSLTTALLAAHLTRTRCEAAGRPQEAKILNVMQFALLFNFDISCLLRDLALRPGTWHTKLHARHLAMTAFECLEDLTHLLGKDFRAIVRQTELQGILLTELMSLHKELSALKDRENPFLKPLRNGVVAHRDHDAAEQMRLLIGLDLSRLRRAVTDTLNWLTRLHDFCGKLLAARTAARPFIHSAS